MPAQISCPNCKAALSLPDSMHGRPVRCPTCLNTFQWPPGSPQPIPVPPQRTTSPFDFDVPQVPSVRAADEEDFDDRIVRRPFGVRGWEGVRAGLFWFHLSAGAFGFAFLLAFLFSVGGTLAGSGSRAVGFLLGLIVYSSVVFWMMGLLACRHIPRDCEGSRPAGVAVVLSIVSTVAAGIIQLLNLVTMAGRVGDPGLLVVMVLLLLITWFGLLGSAILFFFTLVHVGMTLGHRNLSRFSTSFVAIMFPVGFILLVCLFFISILDRGARIDLGPWAFLVAILFIVWLLGGLGWFIGLVASFSSAIDRAQPRDDRRSDR